MKIFLDECVPLPVDRILEGHDCQSSKSLGWQSLRNGELLRRVEEIFDCFITADQNLRYQQNLTSTRLRIVVLPTNNLRILLAHAADIQEAVSSVAQSEVLQVRF